MNKSSKPTLLLDRDGVINIRRAGKYVAKATDFQFTKGFLESAAWLAETFSTIVVITNQQGIGKELMTHEDLFHVHEYMLMEIENAGGRIDGVYYCPHLVAEDCDCRKPKKGLVEQALADFPNIDPEQLFLVGDSFSDLQLGAALNCYNVWMDTKGEDRKMINEALENDKGFYISGTIKQLPDLEKNFSTIIQSKNRTK